MPLKIRLQYIRFKKTKIPNFYRISGRTHPPLPPATLSLHGRQYYSNSIEELFIAAPIKEQHQLGNETISVEIEKKTEQWLGATLHSTGENGDVLVSPSIQVMSRQVYKNLQPSVI